jgi:autotransporter-associated beta strand protein
VGRIANWTDDDTSKINLNTASGVVSGAAQSPKTEHFKEATDFGTVSGVVSAGSGVATMDKAGAGHWSLGGANTYTGGTTVNAGTLGVGNGTLTVNGAGTLNVTGGGTNTLNSLAYSGAGATAGKRTAASGEFDGGKTLTVGTGDSNVTFAGVVTKSGQRADAEVKREFGYEKSLDGEGRGLVTKTGDGTLTLAGNVSSAPKAPVATPSPRGGDAVVGGDLYFEKQTAQQRPAVVGRVIESDDGTTTGVAQFGRTDATRQKADDGLGIDLMGGTKFRIQIHPADSKAQTSDDALSIDRFGAEQDLKEGTKVRERMADARTDVAGATDESARSRQWMSSFERDKGNATDGKDDAKKSGAAAARGIVAGEPAAQTKMFDDIRRVRISNPRGGTAEGEAKKKLADVQKKEVEELGVDRLAEMSKVTPKASMRAGESIFRLPPFSVKVKPVTPEMAA